jgi:SAM-dependent methyltransferase
MNQNDDILGQALIDFQNKSSLGTLLVSGEILEDEEMDISYYFRDFSKMPAIEQHALSLCKGRVLDVGAGAGSHALVLQENNLELLAIDISPGAVQVMQKRGVKKCKQIEALELKNEKFDTVLLLMNGIGISGKKENLASLLEHLLSLLNPNGQILFDSTDLRYLYEEEDGSFWIDLNGPYYGEMNFTYSYNRQKGKSFDWLYIDKASLEEIAEQMNIVLEFVFDADPYHYLVRIKKA